MTTAIVFLVLFAVILWAFLIGTAKEDQGGEIVAEKHEFPNSTRSPLRVWGGSFSHHQP